MTVNHDTSTSFGEVTPPPAEPSLVVGGAAAGAGTSLAVMFVYQLLRVGWRLAYRATSHPGGTVAPEGLDRVIGVEVVGGLLSLAPAVFAGGVLGALVGGFLGWSWARQGVLRAGLSGALIAYLIAGLLNLVVLVHHRDTPYAYSAWLTRLGLPSLLYVVVFAGVGAHLYLRRRRLLEELGELD